ncbi:MORN repeat-containing protein 4-like protein [Dinothrombium tinctorium]|uniref:MORN repeat-containing protein 4-like protein n=1 Tax=Dinothrombium tinctorium TaxID=1965070 RepID=A0A3S3NPL9_9ACAR|nr:MORN repeat-containing protein 4-like protein [Dinothrombium tinctorium]RWS06777.1 MORN repeat-containing protein 4-like protein [Dinothrombium tinctorium]RWS08228.1 MORN repeat-containing protein 4-like protein [Dinothrombium tinctorium]RWS08255.1 MORN repeat-containing protein 4-like protein [Dinothrombium tinctorium]
MYNTFNDLTLGAFQYEDGSFYEGEWNKKGQKHGYGVYKCPDGADYFGRFENGLPSGLGTLCFADGALYSGEFMQGWFHGHGVFQLSNGARFEGQFRGGRIWGLGLTTFADGSHGEPRHEGVHKDWRFVKPVECSLPVNTARNNALSLGCKTKGEPRIYTFNEAE